MPEAARCCRRLFATGCWEDARLARSVNEDQLIVRNPQGGLSENSMRVPGTGAQKPASTAGPASPPYCEILTARKLTFAIRFPGARRNLARPPLEPPAREASHLEPHLPKPPSNLLLLRTRPA